MIILAIEDLTLGNIQNVLTFIATTITSVGAIGAVFYKLNDKKQKKQQEQFKEEIQKLLEPFNKRIDETIENNNRNYEELKKQVEELTIANDNNDIDTIRRSISAFDNMCRMDINNDSIQKHFYITAFKDIDKWAEYHKKYPNLNGEMNVAIEYIKEHYKKAKFE